MKATLTYKPQDYAYKAILMQFSEGQPLSCDQLNFLYRYEHQFSHPALDSVCRYYLKQYKRHVINHEKPAVMMHPTLAFALPSIDWDHRDVQAFEKHLEVAFSKGDAAHIEMVLTPDVFNHLRELTLDRMIYLHGYRLAMREGFFPGWFPYSIYFQWANVFGVARYDLKTEHGLTKTMITLYLEPRQNRLIEECVQDYLIKNHLAFKPAPTAAPANEQAEKNEERQTNQFSPQLTLSRSKQTKEEGE